MLRGDLVFQDYAVANWFFHLRGIVESGSSLTDWDTESAKAMDELAIAFDEFLEMYGESLGEEVVLGSSQRTYETVQRSPLGNAYLMLYDHSERHLQKNYEGRNEISIKQLGVALMRNRAELEKLNKEKDATTKDTLLTLYGEKRYKCSKATCFWFHEGFKDPKTRDNHIKAHERPYTCQEPDCIYADMGFKTNKELEKHVKNFHPSREDAAQTFQILKATPAKTPYTCHICSKMFTRAFHLRSHLLAHDGKKPFACGECGTAFTRDNDRKRHENTVHARRR